MNAKKLFLCGLLVTVCLTASTVFGGPRAQAGRASAPSFAGRSGAIARSGVAPGTRLTPANAPGIARRLGTNGNVGTPGSGSNRWHGNGNWNHNGNWTHNGNWHRHHHDHDRFVFVGGFGYPFWYDPWYYPYDYYPYTYYNPAVDYEAAGVYDASLTVQVQRRLASAGYYHGAIDGVMGPATRRAIRSYQRSHNLPVNGVISDQLVATMRLG